MNETEAKETRKRFVVSAFHLIQTGGFITEKEVFSRYSRTDILLQLRPKELADVLVLSGMRHDVAERVAEQGHHVWDAIITAANLSDSDVLNTFGVDRLADILPAHDFWSLSTKNKFWLTSAESEGYVAARKCIEGILRLGLDLKILTHGPVGDAMKRHMSAKGKEELGNWLLSYIADNKAPTADDFWGVWDPFEHVSLADIWVVIEDKIASPLGLTLTDVASVSSTSAPAPPPPASGVAPETQQLFPSAAAPVPALATPPEEPLSGRILASTDDEGTDGPKGRRARH